MPDEVGNAPYTSQVRGPSYNTNESRFEDDSIKPTRLDFFKKLSKVRLKYGVLRRETDHASGGIAFHAGQSTLLQQLQRLQMGRIACELYSRLA